MAEYDTRGMEWRDTLEMQYNCSYMVSREREHNNQEFSHLYPT